MKKQTRKQKIEANKNKPAGRSKYALKCIRRAALARKLDSPILPFPILLSKENEIDQREKAVSVGLSTDDYPYKEG